jgi:hypothetical protein
MEEAQRPHSESTGNNAYRHLSPGIYLHRQRAADQNTWYRETRQTHITENGSH